MGSVGTAQEGTGPACNLLHSQSTSNTTMDAIRKKMQSLKGETDSLYSTIQKYEDDTAESNRRADQADCDIRDYGKKVHSLEIEFDETLDKLQKAGESSEENLANTVTKLATTSKEADNILKKAKLKGIEE